MAKTLNKSFIFNVFVYEFHQFLENLFKNTIFTTRTYFIRYALSRHLIDKVAKQLGY